MHHISSRLPMSRDTGTDSAARHSPARGTSATSTTAAAPARACVLITTRPKAGLYQPGTSDINRSTEASEVTMENATRQNAARPLPWSVAGRASHHQTIAYTASRAAKHTGESHARTNAGRAKVFAHCASSQLTHG